MVIAATEKYLTEVSQRILIWWKMSASNLINLCSPDYFALLHCERENANVHFCTENMFQEMVQKNKNTTTTKTKYKNNRWRFVQVICLTSLVLHNTVNTFFYIITDPVNALELYESRGSECEKCAKLWDSSHRTKSNRNHVTQHQSEITSRSMCSNKNRRRKNMRWMQQWGHCFVLQFYASIIIM